LNGERISTPPALGNPAIEHRKLEQMTMSSGRALDGDGIEGTEVTRLKSSDAKSATAGDGFPNRPMRPSGLGAWRNLRNSLSASPAISIPSVLSIPGLTAFTKVFLAPGSEAIVRVIACAARAPRKTVEKQGPGLAAFVPLHAGGRQEWRIVNGRNNSRIPDKLLDGGSGSCQYKQL
jgi:hypothetical protein